MNEQRRSKRKHAETDIRVTNAMTGETIGNIGNLSVDGMLLIANQRICEDALYQFSFSLPGPRGKPAMLEIGVHEQWSDMANHQDQCWAGFRIIDISKKDFDILNAWIES